MNIEDAEDVASHLRNLAVLLDTDADDLLMLLHTEDRIDLMGYGQVQHLLDTVDD